MLRHAGKTVQVVILNACFTLKLAEELVRVNSGVDFCIGMGSKTWDAGARTFAATFYQALGFGKSVQEAFDQGVTAIQRVLPGVPNNEIPELKSRDGRDATRVRPVRPPSRLPWLVAGLLILVLGGLAGWIWSFVARDVLRQTYAKDSIGIKELKFALTEFVQSSSKSEEQQMLDKFWEWTARAPLDPDQQYLVVRFGKFPGLLSVVRRPVRPHEA